MNRQEVIELLEELGLLKVHDEIEVESIALSLDERISVTLQQLGMTCDIKGYRYVRTAITMLYEDSNLFGLITKELYPMVAKAHKTTSSRVERAIRHAIERTWLKGNIDFIHELFSYTVCYIKGKPTNSQFIALLAEKLRQGII